MAIMDKPCNNMPVWFIAVTVVLLIGRVAVEWFAVQNKQYGSIAWKKYRDVKEEVFRTNKPVLLFCAHSNSCEECRVTEKKLLEVRRAAKISKEFIPVKVIDVRDESTGEVPEKEQDKIYLERAAGPPHLKIVFPEGWDVNGGSIDDSSFHDFHMPFIDLDTFLDPKPEEATAYSIGLIGFDARSGHYAWNKLPEALVESRKSGKPLFVLFTQTRDKYCLRQRNELLGQEELEKLVTAHFIPVLITNYERSGKSNDKESAALIASCNVKKYPTVAVIQPGSEPLVRSDCDPTSVIDMLERHTSRPK